MAVNKPTGDNARKGRGEEARPIANQNDGQKDLDEAG
jgi:hypothetical protein